MPDIMGFSGVTDAVQRAQLEGTGQGCRHLPGMGCRPKARNACASGLCIATGVADRSALSIEAPHLGTLR